MSAQVLLLNRNFLALEVTSWQRALALVYLDRALVVDDEYKTYDFKNWKELSQTIEENPAGFVHSPTLKIAIPEVIALKAFDKVPIREVPFTRRNIYHHYGNRCCYCGKQFAIEQLNLDHVVPRSRGGATDWSNIVTSCIPCNLRKGCRLPAEAQMHLVLKPSKPKPKRGAALLVHSPVAMRRSWQRFIDTIYWNSRLEE